MAGGSELVDQILALVSDGSQVVSYKWLSRSFSISSNAAKRLLQEFVDNYGDSVQVVYAVAGWTKLQPCYYSIQLVPRTKLQQTRELLVNPINSHVYSVQPCIPKDPAELWNSEYVQAEELFNEPPDKNNCLRDNRFSAISSSSSTCSLVGETSSAVVTNSSKVSTYHVPAPCQLSDKELLNQKTSPDAPVQAIEANAKKLELDEKAEEKENTSQFLGLKVGGTDSAAGIEKTEEKENTSQSLGLKMAGTDSATGKVTATVGSTLKAAAGASGKKKAASGPGQTGSSLASLWSRAPAKPKSVLPTAEKKIATKETSPPAAGDGEARVRAFEAMCDASSGDDDAVDFVCIQRGRTNGSGRKRHIIFDDDLSDVEDEKIVNLTSPEVSKRKMDSAGKVNDEDKRLRDDKACRADEGNTKMITPSSRKAATPPSSTSLIATQEKIGLKDSIDDAMSAKASYSLQKAADSQSPGVESQLGNGAALNMELQKRCGPKKRKVLKSYINDRGREVTQVVWEEDDAGSESKSEHTTPKEESTVVVDRPIASGSANLTSSIQHPATKSSGKPTSRTSGKESQKGKIMSFFKKQN